MSKRANPTLIGAFVILALILGVAAVILFGSGKLFSQSERFVMYFEDSLNGLDLGAPVKFKGVRIGEVTDIRIRYRQNGDSNHVPVFIDIDTERLQTVHNVQVDLADYEQFQYQVLALNLRSTLQQESFVTGKLFIEMDYFPDAPPPQFVQQKGNQYSGPVFMEIPTLRSGLTEVIQKVSLMVNEISQIDFGLMGQRINSILGSLERKLDELDVRAINEHAVTTLENVNILLSDPELRRLAGRLNGSLDQLEKLLIESQDLVNNLDGQIEPLGASLQRVASRTESTLTEAESLLANLSEMTDPESPTRDQLQMALEEMTRTLRSLRQLTDYLERNPNALFTGKLSPDQ